MDDRYKAVFEHQVWDYYAYDMESCFESARRAPTNGGRGGQNFTAALITLSVIDFCAGFYKGSKPSTDDIASFITHYFTQHDQRFSDVNFSKRFYSVFRHGLAHQWSPAYGGVSMDFDIDEMLLKENGVPVLNVPPFYDLVCKALRDYEAELATDSVLNSNFTQRYDTIIKADKKQANRLLKLY